MYKNIIESITINKNPHSGGLLKVLNLESEKKEKGKLILLVEIETSDKDNIEIIDILASELKRQFFNAPTRSAEYAFEHALSKANLAIKDILLTKPKNWLNKLHIVVLAIKESEIHLSSVGNTHVFLSHKDKIIDIIQDPDKNQRYNNDAQKQVNPVKIFSNVVSGAIAPGQCLTMVNESVMDYLSPERIRKISLDSPPEESVKKINELLAKTPEHKKFAIIFIKKIKSAQPEKENTQTIRKENQSSPAQDVKNIIDTYLQPETKATVFKKAKEAQNETVGEIKKEGFRYIQKTLAWILAVLSTILEKSHKIIKSLLPLIASAPKISKSLATKKEARIYYFSKIKNSFYKKFYTKYQTLPRSKKIAFPVLVIFIIIFAISIVTRASVKSDKVTQEKIDVLTTQINEKIDQAKAALIYKDKTNAKTSIYEANALLTDFFRENEAENETYIDLKKQLDDLINKIENRVVLNNINPVVSISELTPNSQKQFLNLADNSIFYLSNQAADIKEFNTESNLMVSLSVTSANFDYPVSLGDQNIALLSQDKVAILNTANETIGEQVFTYNPEIRYTGYGGNIYTLNKPEDSIQRFRRAGAGFTPAQDWLKNEYDFNNALDIAVDGSIYVLEASGYVDIFFNGAQERSINLNTENSFSDNTIIYTNADLDNLYILDKENGKIIMVSKNGDLLAQYVSEKFIDSDNLVIDPREENIYLLGKSGIYKIDITLSN